VTTKEHLGHETSQVNMYRTQWAAQFIAAAELTRRGCIVALKLGNAPATDLLVQSPGGRPFSVDVRGLAGRNWWLVSERTDHPGRPRLRHPLHHRRST
jgi:hypothetical protein